MDHEHEDDPELPPGDPGAEAIQALQNHVLTLAATIRDRKYNVQSTLNRADRFLFDELASGVDAWRAAVAARAALVARCVERLQSEAEHPTPQAPEPKSTAPIPMRLTCPSCCELHVDEGEFASKPHHTHACQHCGNVWRPALVPTVGVRFLPGFQNGGGK